MAAPAPEEAAWVKIKDTKDPEQVREFLKQYPDSPHQAAAIAHREGLPGQSQEKPRT